MRLVLPSNASADLFPNNTLAKYTVQLPQPINLTRGGWEVALAECQFHKSWYNVKDGYISITRLDEVTNIAIEDGFYQSNQTLIDKLNEALKCKARKLISDNIKFVYDDISRKCSLHYDISNFDIAFNFQLSPSLRAILNIDESTLSEESPCVMDSDTGNTVSVITANDVMRLNIIYNIMIYSDIAEPNIVGDIETPLLRSIAVEGEHWRYQSTEPTKLQFVPIRKNALSTITVYIYTDFGELVPFTNGRTVVTLELRRAKSLHLY